MTRIVTYLWFSTACVAFTLLYLTKLQFYLATYLVGCTRIDKDSSDRSGQFRFLLVADPHLLSERRGAFDSWWIDEQVKRSLEYAIQNHRPTDVILLGDIFDAGRSDDDAGWEMNRRRFDRVFGGAKIVSRLHGIPGNHDVGDAHYLRRESLNRFERALNISRHWKKAICVERSRSESGACLHLIGINSMALGRTPRDFPVYRDAPTFLKSADSIRGVYKEEGPLILLTHLPLFRKNDAGCGSHRLQENGHVTYSHPLAPLGPSDVLDRSLSESLLADLNPSLVFSGHTHAICSKTHQMPSGSEISEFTVPAFGWRMRPDPSYVVVDLDVVPGESSLRTIHVAYCRLPHEHVTFVVAGLSLASSGLGLLASILHIAHVRSKNKGV